MVTRHQLLAWIGSEFAAKMERAVQTRCQIIAHLDGFDQRGIRHFVGGNAVPAGDLPETINAVHRALAGLAAGEAEEKKRIDDELRRKNDA